MKRRVSQDTVNAIKDNAEAFKIGVSVIQAGDVDPVKIRELLIIVASLLLLIAKITPTKVDDLIAAFIAKLLGIPPSAEGQ